MLTPICERSSHECLIRPLPPVRLPWGDGDSAIGYRAGGSFKNTALCWAVPDEMGNIFVFDHYNKNTGKLFSPGGECFFTISLFEHEIFLPLAGPMLQNASQDLILMCRQKLLKITPTGHILHSLSTKGIGSDDEAVNVALRMCDSNILVLTYSKGNAVSPAKMGVLVLGSASLCFKRKIAIHSEADSFCFVNGGVLCVWKTQKNSLSMISVLNGSEETVIFPRADLLKDARLEYCDENLVLFSNLSQEKPVEVISLGRERLLVLVQPELAFSAPVISSEYRVFDGGIVFVYDRENQFHAPRDTYLVKRYVLECVGVTPFLSVNQE